jgi:hypothetical protein
MVVIIETVIDCRTAPKTCDNAPFVAKPSLLMAHLTHI